MNKKIRKKISIVGFGRFGKVLYKLLKNDFDVTLFDKHRIEKDIEITSTALIATNLSEVYASDVIFFAVPISSFERVIQKHKKFFKDNHLLIDVLSVKTHPKKVFEKYLKAKKTQALLTHPMFGPDSSKRGFEGLPLIMDRFLASKTNYKFWKKVFEGKKLKVIEMSAREHDELAASSQGLTHFIGRLLDLYGLEPTKIDSLGAKKLSEVKSQTCNDTWQLFTNLQHYNPYTNRMRIRLGMKYDELHNRLLPKQISSSFITYGIQGGRGSFNEEAIQHYLKKNKKDKHKTIYLYTTQAVLTALHEGSIDQGLFAIHNSVGGIVKESVNAMAKYKFRIIEEFVIKISHALMIRSDAKVEDINTIMSHPQVFAQCKQSLSDKYSNLKQVTGKGKLIDHALVAKRLSEKKLPKNIATMGSKVLAQIYDLKVVENDLQDAEDNFTSFLLVKRA